MQSSIEEYISIHKKIKELKNTLPNLSVEDTIKANKEIKILTKEADSLFMMIKKKSKLGNFSVLKGSKLCLKQ